MKCPRICMHPSLACMLMVGTLVYRLCSNFNLGAYILSDVSQCMNLIFTQFFAFHGSSNNVQKMSFPAKCVPRTSKQRDMRDAGLVIALGTVNFF
jgi:hypothetical protein